MKTMKALTTAAIFATITFGTTLTLAQDRGGEGGAHGGGGHHSCQEYINIAGKIVNEMIKLEKSSPDTFSNILIDLEKYNTLIKQPEQNNKLLKCLPVEKLDRDARSSSENNTTYLNWTAWDKLITPQKIQLAAHELSVMAGDENDGEYFISNRILNKIMNSSSFLKYLMRAESVVLNSDGTITFMKPFTYFNNERVLFGLLKTESDKYLFGVPVGTSRGEFGEIHGICKYLGLNSAVSYSLDNNNLKDYATASSDGKVELGSKIGKREGSYTIFLAMTSIRKNIYSSLATITCK